MEAHERVKYLRKRIFQLSQNEFAKKINISRPNLGNIEIGKINMTERVLSDVCRVFQVRKEWIMSGEEPMFEDSETPLDPLDIEISRLYTALNDRHKNYLYGYMHRLLEEQEEGRES